MNCAAHIWCWPTPETKTESGPADRAEALDRVLRGQGSVVPGLEAQRVGRAKPVQRHPPLLVVAGPPTRLLGLDGGDQLRDDLREVADDRARRPARFLPISAGSMSAWMTAAFGAKDDELAGHAIVEPGTEGDQEVGLLQGPHGGDRAVHSGHSQVLRDGCPGRLRAP